MINIYVQRTLAKACSDAPITSASVGLTAQFLFSEEWNELTKKAIFETDNYKEPVDVPASGEVIVPESVLVYPWTQLRVGVRGESEDGYVVIPTVYADCGTIRLGANTTPVGTPPTPSQAEYLQAQIDELRESGVGGGTPGKPGKDGISATHEWNGTVLTITSASGTSSADLKGDTGAAGKTPVRGTDYWTAADIAEIKSYVDEAILGGAW